MSVVINFEDINELTFFIAPKDRGQVIVVSYAAFEDGFIKKVRDLSEANGVADYSWASYDDLDGPFEPWNSAPDISDDAWRKVVCR
jgi:hypothetical protein